MKIKQRILSFFLALVLLFSCMALTVSAVMVEVAGSEITKEDAAAGNTDAITSAIPATTGPLSYAEIKAILGDDGMASADTYSVYDKRSYATYIGADGKPA